MQAEARKNRKPLKLPKHKRNKLKASGKASGAGLGDSDTESDPDDPEKHLEEGQMVFLPV